MSEREIRRAAKEYRFSGYKKILQGRFDPVNIEPDILNDISAFYRSINRPFDRRGLQRELNLIRRDYLRRPLTAEGVDERKRPVFRIEMPSSKTQTSTAPTPPTAAVETGAVSNLPSTAPVQPMTNQVAQSTIQDPRTRELFERLRGTG